MPRTVPFILASILVFLGGPPARADLTAAYALVPPDSAGAVLVGDIKKTSDDIAACLEGMERSQLLLGGRPIDQLRALLGITSGLNERRAGAIVYPHAEFGSPPLYVLPTFNPDEFLTANFEPHPSEPGAWMHSSGTVLYAKAVGDSVVVLGENAADVTAYNAGVGLADTLNEMFADDAKARLARADVVIYTAASAIQSMAIALRQAGMQATEMGEGLAPGVGLSVLAAFLPTDIVKVARAALLTINFDPLGLGVNTFVAIDEQELSVGTAGGDSVTAPLSLIPQQPFYLAASMDVAGVDGIHLRRLLVGDKLTLPEWIEKSKAVQFIAPPSSLGVQGGMLNEASLVIGTDDPASLIASIREEFMAPVEGVMPTWSVGAREAEGVMFDGYELAIEAGGWEPIEVMIGSLLFGRGGIRGFVGEVDGHVLVTFSRRPGVLARAIKAIRGENTLSQSSMLRAMGAWLPARPDVLVFVGVGQIGELLGVMFDSISAIVPLDGFEPPHIDPGTKPVGFGVDLREGLMETGLIVPADALAVLFDVAKDQVLKGLDDAEVAEDG